MYAFEQKGWADGYSVICGVDDAGRGLLTGPVFAGAVILPKDLVLDGLNDSKKLSAKKREQFYQWIQANAISCATAQASEQEIDAMNILNATMLAMCRAVQRLTVKPDLALVDGNCCRGFPVAARCIVKGDNLSASIAAASILAKVERDRYMVELDAKYPEYQFAKHKGYPTQLHYELLKQYGISPVHRRSFLRKWEIR